VLDDEGIRPSEVRLLKADVEGYEPEVLAGAARVPKQGSPIVVLEANTEAAKREVAARMDQDGYQLVRVADGGNLLFARFPGTRPSETASRIR
jgi:hypothetical protein